MLPRITPEELEELARSANFALDSVEAEEYRALTDFLLGVMDEVDEQEPVPPENVRASRNAGRRPEPGEDPLNSIVRWCRVGADENGPLAGKRIALKDSIAIAGIPMTCGSRLLDGYVPVEDSVVAARILRAGGEVVAVTNMDNFAFSGGGDTSWYGPTLCPFDRSRTAGGSSSGSAAGLWYEGIDSSVAGDQGGSIRVPAAWCGVVGLKPTHGLVPYTGIVGIDQTFDHAGPMAQSVEATALLLQVLAGKHPSDPRQRDVETKDCVKAVAEAPLDFRGVRLGVVAEGLGEVVGADKRVVGAFQEAVERLRSLGAKIRELSLPEHVQCGGVAFAGYVEGMTALLRGGGNGYHWSGRYCPELALALSERLASRADDLPPSVKAVFMTGVHLGRLYRGAIYAKAQNLRPRLRDAYDRALGESDALLFPTTPGLPHPNDPELAISERVKRGWAVLANTYPTDFTGHPALSIPAAEAEGLPVGVMFVGRHFSDDYLLALARTYERAFGRLPERPPFEEPVVVPALGD
jgi:amidase